MKPSGKVTGQSAVTLDLWLTLIAERDGTQRSMRRYEARALLANEVLIGHGVGVGRSALADANRRISELVTADHDLGIDLEFSNRVGQMLSLVEEDLPERLGEAGLAEVAAAIDRAFLESPPHFLPGAKDVLAHLYQLDVKVALISNTGMTSATAYREWFGREGVLEFFDHLAFSNEVACAKPSPDIFCPTLGRLNVLAENSLHIGDNLLTDVSGAAGVGMKTGWISGYDDREPIVPPDYTLESVSELPAVVEHWLRFGKPIGA
ncbi:MAG: HAD family hydrolase [Chloroflexi bacterium]|nr:HAD family hydrolase [Chloroflexota bacterium]MDA1297686.1 HAD family hydrolase [Chloroflexota bacterium]